MSSGTSDSVPSGKQRKPEGSSATGNTSTGVKQPHRRPSKQWRENPQSPETGSQVKLPRANQTDKPQNEKEEAHFVLASEQFPPLSGQQPAQTGDANPHRNTVLHGPLANTAAWPTGVGPGGPTIDRSPKNSPGTQTDPRPPNGRGRQTAGQRCGHDPKRARETGQISPSQISTRPQSPVQRNVESRSRNPQSEQEQGKTLSGRGSSRPVGQHKIHKPGNRGGYGDKPSNQPGAAHPRPPGNPQIPKPSARGRGVSQVQDKAGGRPYNREPGRSEHHQNLPSDPTPDCGGVSLNSHDPSDSKSDDESRSTFKSRSVPGQRKMGTSGRRESKHGRTSEQLSATKNVKLEEIIKEKDAMISELMETISLLHQRDGEQTKDDNYFATRFSDVACSIEQWVLQHCQNSPNNLDFRSFPAMLQKAAHNSVCEPDRHLRSGDRTRIISAIFAQLLCDHVLYNDGVATGFAGARETTMSLRVVSQNLGGTFYQRQRWRAATMYLLARGNGFESNFPKFVDFLTEELGNLLLILAPAGCDNFHRHKGLRDIVEQVVDLVVEIHKQPDMIYLKQALPGSVYMLEHMQDVNCVYTDRQLEDGEAILQTQIFPAVLRVSCESDGDMMSPGVVMKAKVAAKIPSREAHSGFP